MSNFLLIIICGFVGIIISQKCQYIQHGMDTHGNDISHVTVLEEYLQENIPVICSNPDLIPSLMCDGSPKFMSNHMEMKCVNLHLERCGCIQNERYARVIIMIDATYMNSILWEHYLMEFTKRLNDDVLINSRHHIHWAYVIYGENDAVISLHPAGEWPNWSEIPMQFSNNIGGDFCKGYNTAIQYIKNADLGFKRHKNIEDILILFQFGTPINPTMESPCLDSNNNIIKLHDSFDYISTFMLIDPITLKLNAIESHHGNFDNCVYYTDWSNFNFTIQQIYNNFFDETNNHGLLRYLLGGISDSICFASTKPYTPRPTRAPTRTVTNSPTTVAQSKLPKAWWTSNLKPKPKPKKSKKWSSSYSFSSDSSSYSSSISSSSYFGRMGVILDRYDYEYYIRNKHATWDKTPDKPKESLNNKAFTIDKQEANIDKEIENNLFHTVEEIPNNNGLNTNTLN